MEALTAHVQTVFADETVTVAEVGGGGRRARREEFCIPAGNGDSI